MADIVLELLRQLSSKQEKLTLQEANVLLSLKPKMIKGFTVGAVVGSGLTWIATRRLFLLNRIILSIATRRLFLFNRIILSIGATGITGPWGVETSLNSWIDHVLALEGSRIQKELVSVIVQKFPDNRRMQLISKHFYSERVFDDSTSDQLQLRRWYWNFRRDNAAYSQSTPDTDNHSDSDSKQNDLESKQVPMDTGADPDSSGGGLSSGGPKN